MGGEEIRGNSLSTNYQNYHGGGEGTRTPDLLAASETLSQLSYTPTQKLPSVAEEVKFAPLIVI